VELTHDFLELLRRAVHVQNRVFGIRCQEQGDPVLADFEMCSMVSIRARHVDAGKVDFGVHRCFLFGCPSTECLPDGGSINVRK
jgi:hypothetical protein